MYKNKTKEKYMSIKKINLLPHKNNYFQKQIKKPTLSDKFKQKLSKPEQTSVLDNSEKLSTKDRKALSLAHFTCTDTNIDYYNSIFGRSKPQNIGLARTLMRCLSSILNQKLSLEDSIKKLNTYQELAKINCTKTFCLKAFNQIKKDFGYKDLNIPLKFAHQHASNNASWNPTQCVVTIYTNLAERLDGNKKSNIIEYILHEFRHIRQTEMAYRTSPEKLLNALEEDLPRRLVGTTLEQPKETLKKVAAGMNKTLEELQNMLKELGLQKKVDYKLFINGKEQVFDRAKAKENLDKTFGKLKPFKENSIKYQYGLNYIKGEATYIPVSIDREAYKNGILEKDAYTSGDKWHSILDITD